MSQRSDLVSAFLMALLIHALAGALAATCARRLDHARPEADVQADTVDVVLVAAPEFVPKDDAPNAPAVAPAAPLPEPAAPPASPPPEPTPEQPSQPPPEPTPPSPPKPPPPPPPKPLPQPLQPSPEPEPPAATPIPSSATRPHPSAPPAAAAGPSAPASPALSMPPPTEGGQRDGGEAQAAGGTSGTPDGRRLRLARELRPRYPEASRLKGEEGLVTVAITVRADGTVAAVSVVRSSGFPSLDRAAVEGARKARFVTASGMPAAGEATLSFRFRLID